MKDFTPAHASFGFPRTIAAVIGGLVGAILAACGSGDSAGPGSSATSGGGSSASSPGAMGTTSGTGTSSSAAAGRSSAAGSGSGGASGANDDGGASSSAAGSGAGAGGSGGGDAADGGPGATSSGEGGAGGGSGSGGGAEGGPGDVGGTGCGSSGCVGVDGGDTDSGVAKPTTGGGYTPPFDPSTVPGIQPLFDGATLTGWNCNTTAGGWSVKNATIVGGPAVAGQFCATVKTYSEFRLFASIMQVSGNGGHSGIGFGGQTPPSGKWSNGDFKFLDLMTPSYYFWDYSLNSGAKGHAVTFVDMTKAPYNVPWSGQWFQVEMTVSLSKAIVRAAMNGVDYLTYDIGTPDPFKDGPIGLQAHAGNQEVRYKDLWIQVNPTDPNTLVSVKK